MLSTDTPQKVQTPFANSGDKTAIPITSQIGITPGAPSYETGWPPLCSLPLEAGGIPPSREQFNEALNRVTDIQRWQSMGGMFKYDATLATANSGYPRGAILVNSDASGLFFNNAESNTTDPDAAGAGWLDFLTAIGGKSAASFSASAGSSLIGHIRNAFGAVATTVKKRFDWLAVQPEEFGASESWDGVSTDIDDTAAVQLALDTGRTVLLRRQYRITDTLHSAGQIIRGEGYQTGFVFDSAVGLNGIEFLPVANQTTSGCFNFSILKRGADGGSAIKTPYQAAQYTTLRSSFQYEKLLIAGYTKPTPGTNNAFETLETWLCGIEQGDAWNIGLCEVDCYGSYRSDTDPALQVQSKFIRLHAESAMLTAHIGQITCSNVYRGIEIGDRAFFQISNFDFAHVFDGIFQVGGNVEFAGDGVTTIFTIPSNQYGSSSPSPPPATSVRVVLNDVTQVLSVDYSYASGVVTFFTPPASLDVIKIIVGLPFGESKIMHGNINAQRFGIYFQDIGTREIVGAVIRRHKFGWKGATYDWAGIRLVNCNYVWITDCQIQPDASSGAFSGTSYGVQAIECAGVTALGTVIGANIARGFLIDATTMFNAEATQSFQTDPTDIIFRAIRNTRLSRIGSYVRVSTFSGAEYSDDGSITPGAIQQFQRNVIPEAGTPSYYYRRSTSPTDQKNWKTASGAASWSLQMSNDADSSNVNAIIVNRSALVCTSMDFRTPQVKLNNGPTINVVEGSPEGVLVANIGSTAHRTNGGAGTSFYVKESGTGNTGWVGK